MTEISHAGTGFGEIGKMSGASGNGPRPSFPIVAPTHHEGISK
ncbi:hypothetical protein [Rhizobium leguminosarum]|nr:hypothetical protein [Rhizobium leguminosarum]